jgi:hypothetical protein
MRRDNAKRVKGDKHGRQLFAYGRQTDHGQGPFDSQE